ncbi:uncharacterized protein si:ch211-189a15.5 [Labrus mixtus]|uniref:uncharacterized protein si:ch211-189a15.5 n=1 Tax=Labrus mixtus TaxID=508554 RepID=UPI0029C0E7D9|nr:uncharacterized protein si:ch211-189a15.5 [Labrus mixtus]
MKDGVEAGEKTEVSRQNVFEHYQRYFHLCTKVGPCRDEQVLEKAAQYLQREPEPRESFTLFPFYQSVSEGCAAHSEEYRTFLSTYIKATELLETLCVNLLLQPWKKEIKTLKTFTGPFVYCLLPVFSSSTLQSVLASIGYLPHTDTPLSEYRLSEDGNQDRAMLVGFELMLARVECDRLLELHDAVQTGQLEWQEVLHRRLGPTKPEETTDKKATCPAGQNEEEKKREEEQGEEVPLHLDSRIAVKPQPKPRRCHINSHDQSIMEMQMNYPDLAFRGRPLLSDKPHRANSSRSSSKVVHTVSSNNTPDDGKAANLSKRDSVKGTKSAATTIRKETHGTGADDVFVENVKRSDCNNRSQSQTAAPGDDITSSSCNTDGGSRAGATAEQSLKPGEPQAAEDALPLTQQTPTDSQNQKLPSLRSKDRKQNVRELDVKMGQLIVQETKEEGRQKEDDMKGEEKKNRERGRHERTPSTEEKAEERNLTNPLPETGPAPSHAARRCTTSSESGPAVTKAQKQPSVLTNSTTDSQSVQGGSEGQQRNDTKGAETGQREEEQLAQSYVIVENSKK